MEQETEKVQTHRGQRRGDSMDSGDNGELAIDTQGSVRGLEVLQVLEARLRSTHEARMGRGGPGTGSKTDHSKEGARAFANGKGNKRQRERR